MRILIYRHLKLFFKDPINILLSFLSSLVILSLYFLFIRDFTISAISAYGFISTYNDLFVDKLMTSGLIIVIGSTSTLGIVFIYIKDNYNRIINDFIITNTSKLKIFYSYFFTSVIISTIISYIFYFLIILFFIMKYNDYPTTLEINLSLLIIFISNLLSSSIIFIISFFINNFNSFTTFETLYGVVIGFFTGVYIPIGYYPDIIRNIFFYFPLCQTTSLLRKVNTAIVSEEILSKYPKEVHSVLYETFGIDLVSFKKVLNFNQTMLFIIIALIILQLVIILYHKLKE